MKALIVWIAGMYSVTLIGFLVYLRHSFLQIVGEGALPEINFDLNEDWSENE
jgi:hypothetical protein